ncbi:uncharacterized protein LOC142340061 isoform X2 [Convolutriloba macropyga]|uniref:uncharacterized protein LOC142340061 isoform X2 n=1 Tax=Convolutriloba macropyga TaxID=536237 RepID=UPI003F51D694
MFHYALSQLWCFCCLLMAKMIVLSALVSLVYSLSTTIVSSEIIENGMQEGDQQPYLVQAIAAHEQQQLAPGEDQSQPPSMYHQQPPAFYNFMVSRRRSNMRGKKVSRRRSNLRGKRVGDSESSSYPLIRQLTLH